MSKEVQADIVLSNQEALSHVDYGRRLLDFEDHLIGFIDSCGLPSQGILVPVTERGDVFKNIETVLASLPSQYKTNSVYISKFIAATSAGLFDSALNYIWDETVYELRKRVSRYDLDYFFDVAIKNPDKRKELKTEEDLLKISDDDLVKAARGIELISEMGFKHLDFIRYMRNFASAAHPNHNEITGLQLISWLQTCIREVITLPETNIQAKIKSLLNNIRSNVIHQKDASQISSFFVDLNSEQASRLAEGFFGIYINPKSASQARDNIRLLASSLWSFVDEETKNRFGIRYSQYTASNDKDKADLSKEFLVSVNGQPYIPDNLRAVDIEEAIQNLINAHNAWQNFYMEPAAARQLANLVDDTGKIPSQVKHSYVEAVVDAYLTNGNGVATGANPYYEKMIRAMTEDQIILAVLSFRKQNISSKLQFSLCKDKYNELLTLAEPKITKPQFQEVIALIKKFSGKKDTMHKDRALMQKVEGLLTFL